MKEQSRNKLSKTVKDKWKVRKGAKRDPTIMEIYEKANDGRRLVGYQQYNLKTKGFIFIFSEDYPKHLIRGKIEEIGALAGLLDIPMEIVI